MFVNTKINTFMKISDILEGGWASTLTQNTKITPALVGQTVVLTEKFLTQMNRWLENNNHEPVKLGNPVGSSHYWKRDLKQNPEKVYGDVDYLMYIPQLEGNTNSQNSNTYAKLTKEFVNKTKGVETSNGLNLIFNIGDDYVQVDLVHGYYELKDWLRALLPEYNVKGVIGSSLYSSVAQALNLSIGSYGVQAKIRNGSVVPFSQRKDTKLITISTSPDKWARDILLFFSKLNNQKPELSKGTMGIDPNENRVADIADAAKWLAENLENNNLLGKGNFSEYQSADQLIEKIRNIFVEKMEKQINNPKFNKAETKDAIAKVEQTKKKFNDAISWVNKLL